MPVKAKNKRASNDFMNSDYFVEDDSDDVEVESSDVSNFENEMNDEITDHMKSIREATKNSRKSLENQWSTDFYFCAYFADQAQRDEFLKKIEALNLVKDNFINGAALAECLGISLTPKEIEVPKLFAAKTAWDDITM
jgi:hypothetical protein